MNKQKKVLVEQETFSKEQKQKSFKKDTKKLVTKSTKEHL